MTNDSVPTYIPRLDEFLGGGFPRQRITVVEGAIDTVIRSRTVSEKLRLRTAWLTPDNAEELNRSLEASDLVVLSHVEGYMPATSGLAGIARSMGILSRLLQRKLTSLEAGKAPAVVIVNPPQGMELRYVAAVIMKAETRNLVRITKNTVGLTGDLILTDAELDWLFLEPPEPEPEKSVWERLVEGIGV